MSRRLRALPAAVALAVRALRGAGAVVVHRSGLAGPEAIRDGLESGRLDVAWQ